jgi:hypothetical protein
MSSVAAFAQANPDIVVTSDILMEFLATVTKREGAASYESPPRRRPSTSKFSSETGPPSPSSERSSSEGVRSRTSTNSIGLIYGTGPPETPMTSFDKDLPPSPSLSPSPTDLHSSSPPEPSRRASDIYARRHVPDSPLWSRQRSSPLEHQSQPARPSYRQIKSSRRQSADSTLADHDNGRSRQMSEEPSNPPVNEEPFTPTPDARFDSSRGQHVRQGTQDDLGVLSSARPRPPRQRLTSFPIASSDEHGRQRQASEPPLSPDGPRERSPPLQLDATSFHSLPLSPTYHAEDERSTFPDISSLDVLGMARDPSNGSSANSSLFSLSRPSSGFLGESFGANAGSGAGSLSFRPDSIASINLAGGGMSEQDVTSLFRTAQELGRKLKDQERQYLARSDEFEAAIAELQGRLEEVCVPPACTCMTDSDFRSCSTGPKRACHETEGREGTTPQGAPTPCSDICSGARRREAFQIAGKATGSVSSHA